MDSYRRRVLDSELDELLPDLSAIAIEGPKGVGKTATAIQRASTVFRMDTAQDVELLTASPALLATAPGPVLIDEWQRRPETWDLVRRAVDDGAVGGRFLLTGSATPKGAAIHSGAGRIDTLRMRPLSFAERGIESPTVSLLQLFQGETGVGGQTPIALPDYVSEIVSSGFPGIRPLPPRARRQRLDGYIQRVVEHEVVDQGVVGRAPARLRAWMAAYAAATASTASNTAIGRAASPGDGDLPARSTVERYHDALTQLWLLDPVPAWLPGNDFARLALTPKHFLADPALAARLLDLDEERLIRAETPMLGPKDRTALGSLFEALVGLSLQTYAQAAEATLHHLRTRDGGREIDFIVHRNDGRNLAFEVKLSDAPSDHDVRHLLWLKKEMGDSLMDVAVVNTGRDAYRRRDGVAVIPLALLGP